MAAVRRAICTRVRRPVCGCDARCAGATPGVRVRRPVCGCTVHTYLLDRQAERPHAADGLRALHIDANRTPEDDREVRDPFENGGPRLGGHARVT